MFNADSRATSQAYMGTWANHSSSVTDLIKAAFQSSVADLIFALKKLMASGWCRL